METSKGGITPRDPGMCFKDPPIFESDVDLHAVTTRLGQNSGDKKRHAAKKKKGRRRAFQRERISYRYKKTGSFYHGNARGTAREGDSNLWGETPHPLPKINFSRSVHLIRSGK